MQSMADTNTHENRNPTTSTQLTPPEVDVKVSENQDLSQEPKPCSSADNKGL